MRIAITGTLEESQQRGTQRGNRWIVRSLRWIVRETDGRRTEVAIPHWAIAQFSGVRVGRTVQITGTEHDQPGGGLIVRAIDITVR